MFDLLSFAAGIFIGVVLTIAVLLWMLPSAEVLGDYDG